MLTDWNNLVGLPAFVLHVNGRWLQIKATFTQRRYLAKSAIGSTPCK